MMRRTPAFANAPNPAASGPAITFTGNGHSAQTCRISLRSRRPGTKKLLAPASA
jgi:hypothetical protein